MRVFLTTLGCRLNEAELSAWTRGFRAGGHRVVARPQDAHVVVVNTCAVTREAARKSRKLVGGLHRDNPGARMVLTGCFAQLEPDRAAALAGVDLVVGNADKDRLVDLVTRTLDAPTMPALATEPAAAHAYARAGRTRAFVKVQDGCRNRCSFCVVTLARGDESSRRVADVVSEIAALSAAGYREAVLTGVHLGGYGADRDTDLSALVRAILRHTDIERLRLSSLEPWDLPPRFFDLWADPRLMPHLHLPLQSGSDPVLRRMRRRCSVAAYRDLVARARAAVPDVNITTDVIVGFPGETDAEFADTLAFVQDIGFGHMHIFSYSARDGTRAAGLPGQLPAAVKRARSRALHAIGARLERDLLARHVGQIRPVLWEGSDPRAATAAPSVSAPRTDAQARDPAASETRTPGLVQLRRPDRGPDLAPPPSAPHAAGDSGHTRRLAGYTDNYLRVEWADAPPAHNRASADAPRDRSALIGHITAARLVAVNPDGATLIARPETDTR